MNSDENGDVSRLAGPAHGRRSEQCATPHCRGPVALTYLGRELCQACWQRQCEQNENATNPAAADAANTNPVPTKECSMPKKSKKIPQSKPDKSTVKSRQDQAAAKTKQDQAKRPRRAAGPVSGRVQKQRLSALGAAAEVLKAAGKPMSCRELITAMAEQGLWTSPAGKTPHATLYSAILREIGAEGASARFKKVDRGRFQFSSKRA